MWTYDIAQDRWQKLVDEVSTGFHVPAAPDENPLVTNTGKLAYTVTCDVRYPVPARECRACERENAK
jgi:hypothetical protein